MLALSDRRVKTDIEKVGVIADVGLGIYNFRYIDEPDGPIYTGVMADEVAELLPEALGPVTEEGYQMVDYGKIKELTGYGD